MGRWKITLIHWRDSFSCSIQLVGKVNSIHLPVQTIRLKPKPSSQSSTIQIWSFCCNHLFETFTSHFQIWFWLTDWLTDWKFQTGKIEFQFQSSSVWMMIQFESFFFKKVWKYFKLSPGDSRPNLLREIKSYFPMRLAFAGNLLQVCCLSPIWLYNYNED